MPTFQHQDSSIRVYTFRAGLLSKVGHDLMLSLDRFEIEAEDGVVEGRFWPESLQVEGAMVGGELDRDELSRKDKRKIRKNVRKDVLETNTYPKAGFKGTYESVNNGEWHVEGELELAGRSENISVDLARQDDRVRGSLEIVPSRWGIEPYKAFLGALTLEDRVVVELDLEGND